ncbi:bifunctional riboflavin kinase/FMN adenylyltransferase [Bacillus sp. AFS002410]|uniref:bifunctional riboflavin kinase/FAD synthetase n=1 Tax=Bacillus sp. AFS002410 TaxID=2033481 RepID=UPI000BEF883E|nr:bifunctional riboflavin kinase/FAD synthetase [Bacillus sp. AFS002410]PEJ60211.1 bifunctional riboflavin kinase/FMN adenylyltransferase [Bacillus sp. AFS002410]
MTKVIKITHPHSIIKEDCKETVLALGFFDGVHIGHQQVIKTAKEIADEKGLLLSVMTFDPHPSAILGNRDDAISYLTPLALKVKWMEKLCVDQLFVVEFSEEFANLQPQEFVDQYIISLNAKHVVAGFDFSFGKYGKGNMDSLPFHSRGEFTQSTVTKFVLDEEKVSSTRIREAIKAGEMEDATHLLGRQYQIKGIVVDGDKRGRTIGFPTANISVSIPYALPSVGVYAVKCIVNGQLYEGMCNIGYKPTFYHEFQKQTIEVNIFDFSDDIYGNEVELFWYTRIRDEKKFNGINELIDQLQKDRETVKSYFRNN